VAAALPPRLVPLPPVAAALPPQLVTLPPEAGRPPLATSLLVPPAPAPPLLVETPPVSVPALPPSAVGAPRSDLPQLSSRQTAQEMAPPTRCHMVARVAHGARRDKELEASPPRSPLRTDTPAGAHGTPSTQSLTRWALPSHESANLLGVRALWEVTEERSCALLGGGHLPATVE